MNPLSPFNHNGRPLFSPFVWFKTTACCSSPAGLFLSMFILL
jgi:hypothetical protein